MAHACGLPNIQQELSSPNLATSPTNTEQLISQAFVAFISFKFSMFFKFHGVTMSASQHDTLSDGQNINHCLSSNYTALLANITLSMSTCHKYCNNVYPDLDRIEITASVPPFQRTYPVAQKSNLYIGSMSVYSISSMDPSQYAPLLPSRPLKSPGQCWEQTGQQGFHRCRNRT